MLNKPEESQLASSDQNAFNREVFYVAVDSVIARITTRYEAARHINDLFSFLWQYLKLSDEMVHDACTEFGKTCGINVNDVELKEELLHLEAAHIAKFGEKQLDPFALLNIIVKLNSDEIFYNICTALRIFCTMPVTVASAERSFSKHKFIKMIYHRSCTFKHGERHCKNHGF